MNFDKWKKRDIHKGAFFIADGILDKGAWGKSKVKVLFLMKEAYESDEDSTKEWNLNDYLRETPLSSLSKTMWWSIAQWLKGINHLHEHGNLLPFDQGFKNDPSLNEVFRSCAIINLKKSGGISRSSDENIKKYVESDWDLIWMQIEEINPDLIICGSTYPLIASKLETPKHSHEWFYEANGYKFLDYWHPAAQWPYKIKYYSILSALSQSAEKWIPKT
ncbi:hypothetical protein AB6C94_21660 [Vibrio splendidus]|uniref:Uracil-DNA glycosylase-like domain-containing protein n=1 Tax=Vibrio splendidus TaxID=29497 RepID=A0A7Y4D7A4_VIBSP|nr:MULTISPECIES: hypothetical protein [Vibrio]NOJ14016.1 hypothetical protein [Vibrio splendidus]OBT00494.1 hypothetical protein A9257_07375 [Vibrio cyclitrophicus]PMJ02426.1 hypothetical protein BCU63_11285 [Vibrio splendidus]PMJ67229.1 hypothetical protein BCU23_18535 [Vibrio splendidus]